MTNSIFIFTAAAPDAQKHYQQTIVNGYDLEEVLPLIEKPEHRQILENAYPGKRCYVWGAQIGGKNEGTWNNMYPHDLVLGYWGRSIRCAAYVVMKIRSAALATKIWGNSADPFELVYFLTRPVFCNVSIHDLPLGDSYMCFTRLGENTVQAILNKFGTSENFVAEGLLNKKPTIPLDVNKIGTSDRQCFSWLSFFEEMLNIVCSRYDKTKLCEVFHKIFEHSGGRTDQFEINQGKLLQEIDPLTFIAFFNRGNTLENRISYCTAAKNLLGMLSDVPKDFDGIPIFNAMKTWFFPYAYHRPETVMLALWAFAQGLNNNKLTDELFSNALAVEHVGVAKLTAIMFICKPNDFISFDSVNRSYFKKNGLELSVESFTEYEQAKLEIKNRFAPKTFYEISYDAYLDSLSSPKTEPKSDPALEKEKLPIITEPPSPEEVLNPNYTLEDFVNETGFPPSNVSSWRSQLLRKKQIVFYGPPGTGKTFVAERLAKLMVSGTKGATEIVQFHPAYAYEDFIQGLRPKLCDGQLDYKMEPGRFLRFCSIVESRPTAPCVLIIDEINRAKLSSVFGELMYCLEYRDKQVQLAANGMMFKIPENLFLIGTMNTADRSIALVDHALRRRFYFIQLQPEYEILRSYLVAKGYDADSLVNVLKEINNFIGDPNYELGISFFMRQQRDLKELLPAIWKGEVEPYLQELLYDQPQKVANFKWEKLAEDKLKVWVS